MTVSCLYVHLNINPYHHRYIDILYRYTITTTRLIVIRHNLITYSTYHHFNLGKTNRVNIADLELPLEQLEFLSHII
jgi:hypothetical protein